MAHVDDDEETKDSARTARGCIVEAAWAATKTTEIASRLDLPGQKVVVLLVPDPTWVRSVSSRVKDMFGEGWVAIGRDMQQRSRDMLDVGNRDFLSYLDNGKNVVGIAPTSAMLPKSLVTAADLTITIARPDESVIKEAIRNFLDRRTGPARCVGAGSLDLLSLAATFRKGSSKTIVARIERAAASEASSDLGRVPLLETAVEFGEAREWGLAVSADVKRYLAGELKWSAIDSSVLLHSRPGLGKTTFAGCLAQHMGATLIQTSISELFATSSGYLDAVIKALRETYQRAEANVPTIILWDEVDALPSRVGLDSRSASWWTSVITDFMLMVSVVRPGVVQLACSNFAEKIDPALRRPGRFGRAIELLPPDAAGVESMARFQLAGELADEDITEFGELAAGSTAAEVMAIVRAAKAIARTAGRLLRTEDLVAAAAPQVAFEPEDLRRISIHEAGHAAVGLALRVDELLSLRIGGTGSGLGATKQRSSHRLETRAIIEDRATMGLGGRAAETVCFGVVSSGSHSDLVAVTELIVAVHSKLGLGETLATYDDTDSRLGWLAPPLRAVIEQEMRRLQDRAVAIVRRHRTAVEAIATALAERRHLSGAAARAIFDANPPQGDGEAKRETAEC